MKIDLDELQATANSDVLPLVNGRRMALDRRQALALIARIRELENAVRALAVGSLVGEVTADRARALLEKGVVLP